MKIKSEKKLSTKLDNLVQQAVEKAIENHRLKGESIAISDKKGKVRIIPANEISKLKINN